MSNDQQDPGAPGAGWQSPSPAAGWYQDPWDNHRRRYWDGQQWTGDVSFEPPHNWGGQSDGPQEGHGQVPEPDGAVQHGAALQAPAAAASSSQAVQPLSPQAPQSPGWYGHPGQAPAQWPAAAQEHPTQAGWGGWGTPPPYAGGPYGGGMQHWQGPQAGATNRVHVAVVALIAAIAVLAGIGVGSQINASSSTSNASGVLPGSSGLGNGTGALPGANGLGNGAGTGGISPFGGGTGSTGGAASGSSQLSAAQKAVVSKVDKSVVDVNTDLGYQDGAAAGTGMILTGSGAVLTNNHVIDGATSISVTVVSTGKTYKASVVGTDVTEDVAVIQMQGASGLTPIAVGSSQTTGRGDSVIAIGNAGGAGGLPSAVAGSVSALDQTITASDSNGTASEVLNGLIQTNAPIQAGDSGGPLVDSRGQVIGMDTAASSANQVNGGASVGFAIPISNATTIAAQIQQGQSSTKVHIGATGFLGVSVQSASAAAGSLGSAVGASVRQVVPGSPADSAGIVAGDTITGVDGATIASATSLTTSLRAHHPGDRVNVTWVDANGASHDAAVALTTGPAA